MLLRNGGRPGRSAGNGQLSREGCLAHREDDESLQVRGRPHHLKEKHTFGLRSKCSLRSRSGHSDRAHGSLFPESCLILETVLAPFHTGTRGSYDTVYRPL